MSLKNLKAYHGAKHKKKTVGRGIASGHGGFSTRGGKGQTARSGGVRRPGFEGGQTPLVRRLPKMGGFRNPNQIEYQVVNVGALEIFEEGSTVTSKELVANDLIRETRTPVKLLGDGELTKKLTIEVTKASKSAQEKVEKAKGTLKFLVMKPKPEVEKKSV
ncbi:MAG: 50S ribosomal protein L15 [Patescibacteria group bacterium]